jgi:hypothetical protein
MTLLHPIYVTKKGMSRTDKNQSLLVVDEVDEFDRFDEFDEFAECGKSAALLLRPLKKLTIQNNELT